MEQRLEGLIDRTLENVAPVLQIGGIAIGALLMMIGLILFFKSSKQTAGMICLAFGATAIISGTMNLLFL